MIIELLSKGGVDMKEILNSFFTQEYALSLEEILVHITVSVIIGMVIFLSYWITHTGTIYSRRFNVSLIVLTVLTTTVMSVISSNIVLSLGMVGALSIVRFRNAVKDPRDTVYIFWTIVVGICCGIGDYIIASISTLALFVLLLVVGRIKNDYKRLLVIRAHKRLEKDIQSMVTSFFRAKEKLQAMNTTKDTVEFIYQLPSRRFSQITKTDKKILEQVDKMEGIDYVNIVSQNDDITDRQHGKYKS